MNFTSILKSINKGQMSQNLKKNGWHLIEQNVDDNFISSTIKDIDVLSKKEGVEINHNGTEHRIWKSNLKSKYIEQFFNFSNTVISSIVESEKIAYDILAVRNLRLKNFNDEKSTKLRWHLDSFNNQLKVFLFLSDVDEKSGPFEVIPKTHKKLFKVFNMFPAGYFKITDFLKKGGSRSYAALDDNIIKNIINKGYPVKSFLVKKGTLAVVDTSCIHRAKPLEIGSRYALTSYYR